MRPVHALKNVRLQRVIIAKRTEVWSMFSSSRDGDLMLMADSLPLNLNHLRLIKCPKSIFKAGVVKLMSSTRDLIACFARFFQRGERLQLTAEDNVHVANGPGGEAAKQWEMIQQQRNG